MKQIPKAVLEGLKSVAGETGKELVEEGKKIVSGAVITPLELLGDIKTMPESELRQREMADNAATAAEIKKIRAEMGEGGEATKAAIKGRDVQSEMEEIRREGEEKKKEEEEAVIRQAEEERQRGEEERARLASTAVVSAPDKQRKKRGSAFMPQKKRAAQADMSETAEFFKKAE